MKKIGRPDQTPVVLSITRRRKLAAIVRRMRKGRSISIREAVVTVVALIAWTFSLAMAFERNMDLAIFFALWGLPVIAVATLDWFPDGSPLKMPREARPENGQRGELPTRRAWTGVRSESRHKVLAGLLRRKKWLLWVTMVFTMWLYSEAKIIVDFHNTFQAWIWLYIIIVVPFGRAIRYFELQRKGLVRVSRMATRPAPESFLEKTLEEGVPFGLYLRSFRAEKAAIADELSLRGSWPVWFGFLGQVGMKRRLERRLLSLDGDEFRVFSLVDPGAEGQQYGAYQIGPYGPAWEGNVTNLARIAPIIGLGYSGAGHGIRRELEIIRRVGAQSRTIILVTNLGTLGSSDRARRQKLRESLADFDHVFFDVPIGRGAVLGAAPVAIGFMAMIGAKIWPASVNAEMAGSYLMMLGMLVWGVLSAFSWWQVRRAVGQILGRRALRLGGILIWDFFAGIGGGILLSFASSYTRMLYHPAEDAVLTWLLGG